MEPGDYKNGIFASSTITMATLVVEVFEISEKQSFVERSNITKVNLCNRGKTTD